MSNSPKRILLAASAGGHWIQLMRLLPAFDGHDVSYLSTFSQAPNGVPTERYTKVRDASMWNKAALIVQFLQVGKAILANRPHVIVTTGAAPGYFAIMLGRALGARTIWIDSIANVDELSLAGSKAKRWATVWLTQWPHLEKENGPAYKGSIL